jgi:hypothetical protein
LGCGHCFLRWGSPLFNECDACVVRHGLRSIACFGGRRRELKKKKIKALLVSYMPLAELC